MNFDEIYLKENMFTLCKKQQVEIKGNDEYIRFLRNIKTISPQTYEKINLEILINNVLEFMDIYYSKCQEENSSDIYSQYFYEYFMPYFYQLFSDHEFYGNRKFEEYSGYNRLKRVSEILKVLIKKGLKRDEIKLVLVYCERREIYHQICKIDDDFYLRIKYLFRINQSIEEIKEGI